VTDTAIKTLDIVDVSGSLAVKIRRGEADAGALISDMDRLPNGPLPEGHDRYSLVAPRAPLWTGVVLLALLVVGHGWWLYRYASGASGYGVVTVTDPDATRQHGELAKTLREIRDGQDEERRDRRLNLAIQAMRPEMQDAMLPRLIGRIDDQQTRAILEEVVKDFEKKKGWIRGQTPGAPR